MRDGVGASDLIRWCTVQDVVRDTLFSTIYAHARIGSGFAESGRFPEAIEIARRGVELANSQGNSGLTTQLQGNIALYQVRRPLRDHSLTNGSLSPHSE